MVLRWLLMLIIIAVTALPATAEFYKYRDQSGVIRYTDNLAEVPPDQREKLKTYRGTAAPAPQAQPRNAAEETSGSGGTTPADTDAEKQAGEDIVAELRQRHQAMLEEYESLQKERETLQQPAGRRVSNAEQKQYDQTVAALNARIEDYQKRREAYEKDIETHNEKMKQRIQPGTEQPQAR